MACVGRPEGGGGVYTWGPREGLGRAGVFFFQRGVSQEAFMGTFPIVRRQDEAQYGCFRTKDAILAIYDDLLQ